MTWKDLADEINNMTKKQQGTDVTALLVASDEVLPIKGFTDWLWDKGSIETAIGQEYNVDQVDGVLDEGHPFLTVDF